MRYEIDIFHYLDIYKKEWKRMTILIVITMLIAGIVQSRQPTVYRSTLVALSSEEGGRGSLGKYFGLPDLTMGSSSNSMVFSILKSRRMRNDINQEFNLKDRPKFWWSLDSYTVTGGFAVEVKGSDPEMTKKIANFAVRNLDKINKELKVTTEVEMVKVLDPALRGSPVGRTISKKVIASGLFIFLIYFLFVFFKEYFSQIKKQRDDRKATGY